jgi:hypothetical protein
MLYRPYDIGLYQTYHKEALKGREFVLVVEFSQRFGLGFERKYRKLMDALATALRWCGKARSIRIVDFEKKPIVSDLIIERLWAAKRNCYGVPSNQKQFVVSGPTINPEFIEDYYSMNILQAVDFATDWLDNSWDEPYWVLLRGPDGRVILPRQAIRRMYHAEVKATGGSISEHIVRVVPFLSNAQVLSSRKVV